MLFCGLGSCCNLVPHGYNTLDRDEIAELFTLSTQLNQGRLIVHGLFARADTRNTNGRVYPASVLRREVRRFRRRHIAAGTALGELNHPSYYSSFFRALNLPNISHQVLDVFWRGRELWGTLEVLPTPAGLLLWELYSKGIKLGVSSRGWASVVSRPGASELLVDDDFQLITFDFVAEPSNAGAYLVPICRQYRRPIPDQSAAVHISFMGVGSVDMAQLHKLPSPAAMSSLMRHISKSKTAAAAAAAVTAPPSAQPLLLQQQQEQQQASTSLAAVQPQPQPELQLQLQLQQQSCTAVVVACGAATNSTSSNVVTLDPSSSSSSRGGACKDVDVGSSIADPGAAAAGTPCPAEPPCFSSVPSQPAAAAAAAAGVGLLDPGPGSGQVAASLALLPADTPLGGGVLLGCHYRVLQQPWLPVDPAGRDFAAHLALVASKAHALQQKHEQLLHKQQKQQWAAGRQRQRHRDAGAAAGGGSPPAGKQQQQQPVTLMAAAAPQLQPAMLRAPPLAAQQPPERQQLRWQQPEEQPAIQTEQQQTGVEMGSSSCSLGPQLGPQLGQCWPTAGRLCHQRVAPHPAA